MVIVIAVVGGGGGGIIVVVLIVLVLVLVLVIVIVVLVALVVIGAPLIPSPTLNLRYDEISECLSQLMGPDDDTPFAQRLHEAMQEHTQTGAFQVRSGHQLISSADKLTPNLTPTSTLTLALTQSLPHHTSWQSLLIQPIQRIPRYSMLLDRLIKHTSEDHADHAALVNANKTITEVAEHLNKR